MRCDGLLGIHARRSDSLVPPQRHCRSLVASPWLESLQRSKRFSTHLATKQISPSHDVRPWASALGCAHTVPSRATSPAGGVSTHSVHMRTGTTPFRGNPADEPAATSAQVSVRFGTHRHPGRTPHTNPQHKKRSQVQILSPRQRKGPPALAGGPSAVGGQDAGRRTARRGTRRSVRRFLTPPHQPRLRTTCRIIHSEATRCAQCVQNCAVRGSRCRKCPWRDSPHASTSGFGPKTVRATFSGWDDENYVPPLSAWPC